MVLRGYGAGNDVTAAGVFADPLRTLSWKLESDMVRVYAPASSANMSVGFDVLGAAVTPVDGSLLAMWCPLRRLISSSLNNLGRFCQQAAVRAARKYCLSVLGNDSAGSWVKTVPVAMTLEKICRLAPVRLQRLFRRGGVIAMNEHYGKPLNDTRLLAIMGELEGRISGSIHYDNVAPCFLGGMR